MHPLKLKLCSAKRNVKDRRRNAKMRKGKKMPKRKGLLRQVRRRKARVNVVKTLRMTLIALSLSGILVGTLMKQSSETLWSLLVRSSMLCFARPEVI